MKRLRYFSGLSCFTETSKVQRPAVILNPAVASLCVRLSPVVVKISRVTVFGIIGIPSDRDCKTAVIRQ